MGRRRVSIRMVLIVCFLVVAGLPIVLLSVQRYRSMSEQFFQDALHQDATLARSVAAGLARYMSHRRRFIDALAGEVGRRGLDDRELTRDLDIARGRNRVFRTLLIVDPEGVARVFSPAFDADGRPNVGKRYADREWFQQALRREAETYDVVLGRAQDGRPTVAVSAPIVSGTGQLIGVLAGGLDLDDVRQSVKDSQPALDQRPYRLVVVDSRGRVIAHPSEEWEAKAQDLSAQGVFAAAQRQPEGSVTYRSLFSGDERWGTFVRVRGAGWVVWVSRAAEHWTAQVRDLLRDVLLSGIGALLIVGVAAFALSGIFSRPLRSLGAAMGEVAHRRFERADPRWRSSPIQEFDELIAGFGQMAQTLREQYEDLEAKVAERTRAVEDRAREAQVAAGLLRVQKEIQRGYGELAALLNSLDRSHILQEGSRKIAASLRAPVVTVYLTDNGIESLRLKTYAAVDAAAIETRLLSPAGLPLEVAQRGEPIVLAGGDAATPLQLRTGAGTVDVAAVVGLPLRYQERLLGVLVVAVLQPLTEHTKSFLENAARQLSVALNNAGLFESVRYQSQQLEELNLELRRASDVKSQFLSTMSHELRTPLNSIIGFTEILLTSAREPLSERQRTALEKVLGSGKHLLALINDVLDLSKIEAGRMEPQPDRFALGPLMRECLDAVEPQATAKRLALRGVQLEAALEVVQDRGKLKQIVLNLLANAVKFTDTGSVELRVQAEDDGFVRIEVADTGIGISPTDHAKIFEAFGQVDGRDGSRREGTGLGLPISRRLTELLGGTLTVDSAPGHGSTFTARLPLRYRRGSVRDTAEENTAPEGSPEVLVIDDDRNAVDLIREAVADVGVRVEWAAGMAEGLARARQARPGMILLDVVLQGREDGWDVLHVLKGDRNTRDIPVVVYSVIDNPSRARQLGAAEVLVKPAPPSVIRGLVRRFFDGLGSEPAEVGTPGVKGEPVR